jgi:hypothetical protein
MLTQNPCESEKILPAELAGTTDAQETMPGTDRVILSAAKDLGIA